MDVEHFAIANWVVVIVCHQDGHHPVKSAPSIRVCLPGKLCTHNKMVKTKNYENATAIKRCMATVGSPHFLFSFFLSLPTQEIQCELQT